MRRTQFGDFHREDTREHNRVTTSSTSCFHKYLVSDSKSLSHKEVRTSGPGTTLRASSGRFPSGRAQPSFPLQRHDR
ncbi:hypothetical protein BD310DRAFT_962967 [Dichomitus squalens]|uniref:Uncharacterized protein n=1 Tax=Dichomitus squalens TaxID=114155 RepID=A0A4Q9PFJ1_9APHY|nr:hypothetical protein BD310DRAFT_962967 [Dichomitus squalens]